MATCFLYEHSEVVEKSINSINTNFLTIFKFTIVIKKTKYDRIISRTNIIKWFFNKLRKNKQFFLSLLHV